MPDGKNLYHKNFRRKILAAICLVLFLISAWNGIPRTVLLIPDWTVSAVVSYADRDGENGYDTLKIYDENGNKQVFYYYYSGNRSHLQKDQEVLVAGEITFVTQSTEPGVNADLVVGTRESAMLWLGICLVSGLAVLILIPAIVRDQKNKSWSSEEEAYSKSKIVSGLWTLEIFSLLIAVLMAVIGMLHTVQYLTMENHTTGRIIYQTSRQSIEQTSGYDSHFRSNPATAAYGNLRHRKNYTVLEIELDSPIDGEEQIWCEGNYLVMGNKNVNLGFNEETVVVLTAVDKLFLALGGCFLILHALSAGLLSKRNPYGGRFFWFFR